METEIPTAPMEPIPIGVPLEAPVVQVANQETVVMVEVAQVDQVFLKEVTVPTVPLLPVVLVAVVPEVLAQEQRQPEGQVMQVVQVATEEID